MKEMKVACSICYLYPDTREVPIYAIDWNDLKQRSCLVKEIDAALRDGGIIKLASERTVFHQVTADEQNPEMVGGRSFLI